MWYQGTAVVQVGSAFDTASCQCSLRLSEPEALRLTLRAGVGGSPQPGPQVTVL
jgi:hypothetical protein